jgi:hypothetical protein
MIYVKITGVKSEGRGVAGGSSWFETDNPAEAVRQALDKFFGTWDYLGHGAIVGYRIEVAPENSPRRTLQGWPLPLTMQPTLPDPEP